MSEIVEIDKKSETQGRLIYQNNKHYRKLLNVMEHPEFKEFFELYMKDWETTKTMLMFMKLYETLTKSFPKSTPYQRLFILKTLINDTKLRPKIIKSMEEWINPSSSLNKRYQNLSEKNTCSILPPAHSP